MSDVPLREHFEALREADHKALKTALAASEKAVLKAERQAQEWRDNANEWRAAMNDREARFLTRKEFYTMLTTATIVLGLVLSLVKL